LDELEATVTTFSKIGICAASFLCLAAFEAKASTYDLLTGAGAVAGITVTSVSDQVGGYWSTQYDSTLSLGVGTYNLYVSWTAPAGATAGNADWNITGPGKISNGGSVGDSPVNENFLVKTAGQYKVSLLTESGITNSPGSFSKAQISSVPGPVAGSGILSMGVLVSAFLIARRRKEGEALDRAA
jgi:hypothetical protein